MKTCIRRISGVAATMAAWAMVSMTTALPALAQDAAPAVPTKIDTGDTAWMLTSMAIVLMMTIPGLALFYGGMVRKKNVLATIMQSFATTCLLSIVWMVVGYSLAFGDGGASERLLRRLRQDVLRRHDQRDSFAPLAIPESVFIVPDDVRHHHAGAHRRLDRRSHEVLALPHLHVALADHRLRAGLPLGVGRRLPWYRRRPRLRRRHGRSHQRRHRRSRRGLVPGSPHGLRHREHGAVQSRADRHRRLAAVGWLVRLQRRLGWSR